MAPEVLGALAVAIPMAGAYAWLWARFEGRITALEAEVKECRDARLADAQRWAREVVRGAELALAPPPRDGRLPPPQWDEDTAVRNLRADIEAEVRRYLEERTPPRQRMPSRPR